MKAPKLSVNNFASSANSLYFCIKNRVSRNWFIFILFICGMNKFTRAVFQLVLWFLVLIILGLNQEVIGRFLIQNSVTYFLQAGLIVVLIYYLAPKYLFNKKHFLFFLFSILLVVACAFLSSIMIRTHPEMGAPHPPPGPRMRNEPGPFFVNLLLLTVSYVFAIFLETFAFAQKKDEALILSKTETIENELKFLKSQINPHFLFNSLNNIYSLSMIDSDKAQKSILYLSDMLRYVLYDCEKPIVAIEKEVTYIEDFINLFFLKSSKKYPVETRFTIDSNSLQIAPMLLIPFVENAFKHSNIETVTDAFITIDLIANATGIHLIVENSFKKGPKVQDGVGGIGIVNVRKRLNLLYENNHSIEIVENNNIFRVELKIGTNA